MVGGGANRVGIRSNGFAKVTLRPTGTRIATAPQMVRALWFGVFLVACGGHTEGGTEETGDGDPPVIDTGGGKSNPGSPSNVDGDTPLGECVLGFPPHAPEGRHCTWLADDLCYESRDMACNCVCPRSRDSQCSSGFEGGPDSRVEVYCN